MTTSESIELLVAFAGGGLLAAALGWARTERSENRARAHELAKLRLEKLYGPLYFLTEQNAHLIEHVSRIQKATDDELVNKNWATDEQTRTTVNSDIMQAIGVANTHVSAVRKNNALICTLLSNHYSYIHIEDSDHLQKFVLDHSRMELEFPEGTGLAIPYQVYKRLGISRFLHPEMNNLVRSRVLSLQKAISQ